MTIANLVETPFPDRLAILPSETYVFDHVPGVNELDLRIAGRRKMTNGIEVLATNVGLLAFDYRSSALGGLVKLDFRGSGQVPERIMDNQSDLIQAQISRLQFAMFMTACIYGVHAKSNNSGIDAPLFPALDEIFNWMEVDRQLMLPIPDADRLMSLLDLRRSLLPDPARSLASISITTLNSGLDLAERFLNNAPNYASIDPKSVLVMTYQAMILHRRQHAGASIALSAVVAEVLVEELICALGLVNNVPKRVDAPPGSNGSKVASLSKNAFRQMSFDQRIEYLRDAKVLKSYLVSRLTALRKARNDLMHRGIDAVPRQSGEALTAVRDMLWLATGEDSYELNTGWSFRY